MTVYTPAEELPGFFCDQIFQQIGNYSANDYQLGIKAGLDVLHRELPRAFVNLQAMLDISIVKNLIHPGAEEQCQALHESVIQLFLSRESWNFYNYVNLYSAQRGCKVINTRADINSDVKLKFMK